MPRYGGQDARAPSIFMHGGESKDHEICAQDDRHINAQNETPPTPAAGALGMCGLTKYRTSAVTMTFAKPIGIIQRQPTFMSWS
jgi:hypothetical protein